MTKTDEWVEEGTFTEKEIENLAELCTRRVATRSAAELEEFLSVDVTLTLEDLLDDDYWIDKDARKCLQGVQAELTRLRLVVCPDDVPRQSQLYALRCWIEDLKHSGRHSDIVNYLNYVADALEKL